MHLYLSLYYIYIYIYIMPFLIEELSLGVERSMPTTRMAHVKRFSGAEITKKVDKHISQNWLKG